LSVGTWRADRNGFCNPRVSKEREERGAPHAEIFQEKKRRAVFCAGDSSLHLSLTKGGRHPRDAPDFHPGTGGKKKKERGTR